MRFSRFLAGLVVGSLAFLTQAQDFEVDPVHSSVSFSIRHLMVSNVRGHFDVFNGSWSYDPETGKLSALKGTVDVKSIDTNSKRRDTHLRNEDFFHVKEHPKATIEMNRFEDGKVFARLTIRGFSRPIILDAKISKVLDNPMDNGKTRVQGLTLTGKINRLHYSIGSDYRNAILSEDVVITVELEGKAKAE